jgi:glyceraldehyde 3-phosphate dehydrogenase
MQHVHLLKFDSIHGKFFADVKAIGDDVIDINGKKIRLFRSKDLSDINWSDLGVDVVMECTGVFTSRSKAAIHLEKGAKKVIISAPAKEVDIKTIVYGVNHNVLHKDDNMISIGSCTTNCLAPIAHVLNNSLGIEKGFMTTIHAYTSDQNNIDGSHKSDLRRARYCAVSIIPTSTGAAKALGLVIPSLASKLDGSSLRVPTQNVSVVDLCFVSKRDTSISEVIKIVKDASESDAFKGIIGYEERPLVSIDYNHDSRSSVFDALETKVTLGNMVRVLSWYDNEWAFSVRMIDVARYWMLLK